MIDHLIGPVLASREGLQNFLAETLKEVALYPASTRERRMGVENFTHIHILPRSCHHYERATTNGMCARLNTDEEQGYHFWFLVAVQRIFEGDHFDEDLVSWWELAISSPRPRESVNW